MNKIICTIIACFIFANICVAQIVNRERPSEWMQLINGGSFMDRFETMEGTIRSEHTWGVDSVLNRYVDNGIELDDISFWGGNILQTPDGLYNMFVCGWPENSPKGHMFWSNSTVFHAVSNRLSGPYVVEKSIGKGHNPEAFRLKDGRIVVYVINGYYIADSINSKSWMFGKFDFDSRGRKIIEGLSNLTFAQRQDSSYLMICRGGGIWVSKDGIDSYKQISDSSIYPKVDGEFEDPVVWRDHLQYHMIVNDWLGRIAYYQRSKDGLNWVTEEGEAYMPGIANHTDGNIENWFKYERPKVFQDNYGRAIQMNFAVIDTIKWNDLPNDKHSSKNICIPLNRGMLISVLNKDSITSKTRNIEVLIKSENDFNPQTDIDISSLRFGAHQEVNFGRGCKPIKSTKVGKDLVVIFNAAGSGINNDEFAPKMIGKDIEGKMIYGYAELPYVNYLPPLISARQPNYNKVKQELELEIENFGLSASAPLTVQLLKDKIIVSESKIEALQPYEVKHILVNNVDIDIESQHEFEILFHSNNKTVARNSFVSICNIPN